MTTIAALFVATLLAGLVYPAAFGGYVPGSMRERPCQGRVWRRAFPAARKMEIRAFLSLFVEAFAFRQSERLKLEPSDQALGIYRALYPRQWTPDGLELETLACKLERRYGLRVEDFWYERITLGELFALCQRRATNGRLP